MLSNAYFLAKFRFDTAENEPAKNLQNLQKKLLIFLILLTLTPYILASRQKDPRARGVREGQLRAELRREHAAVRRAQEQVARRSGEICAGSCGLFAGRFVRVVAKISSTSRFETLNV